MTLLRQEVGLLRPQETGAREVGAQGLAGVARRRRHDDDDGGGGGIVVVVIAAAAACLLACLLLAAAAAVVVGGVVVVVAATATVSTEVNQRGELQPWPPFNSFACSRAPL